MINNVSAYSKLHFVVWLSLGSIDSVGFSAYFKNFCESFTDKAIDSIRASEFIFKLPIANVETHETFTDNGDTTWASKKREKSRESFNIHSATFTDINVRHLMCVAFGPRQR